MGAADKEGERDRTVTGREGEKDSERSWEGGKEGERATERQGM